MRERSGVVIKLKGQLGGEQSVESEWSSPEADGTIIEKAKMCSPFSKMLSLSSATSSIDCRTRQISSRIPHRSPPRTFSRQTKDS